MAQHHTNTKIAHTPHYREILRYSIQLVLVVMLLHALAFFGFYYYERNEIHSELRSIAQQQAARDNPLDQGPDALPPYSDQIVVLQRRDDEKSTKKTFYEQEIGENEFLVYAPHDTEFVVAKSEESFRHELYTAGITLSLLLVLQLILLGGWWLHFRNQIKEAFTIH